MLRLRKHLVFSSAALCGLLAGGCATPKVASYWATHPMDIDGATRDWIPGNTTDASGFIVTAANDNQYLYIYAEPDASSAKKLLSEAQSRNLTVWLNADNRKEQTLGLNLGSAEGLGPAPSGRKNGPPSNMKDMPVRQNNAQTGPEQADIAGDADYDYDNENVSPAPQNGGGMPLQPDRQIPADSQQLPVQYIGFTAEELARYAPGQNIEIKIGNPRRKGILEARVPLKLISDSPTRFMVGISADAASDASDNSAAKAKPGNGPEKGMAGGPERGIGGGPGGGMGGGPGGGMRGGPGGGMGNYPEHGMGGRPSGGMSGDPGGSIDHNQVANISDRDTFELWFQVTLADKPALKTP